MIPGEKVKKLQKNKGRETQQSGLLQRKPIKELYKKLSLSRLVLSPALMIRTGHVL